MPEELRMLLIREEAGNARAAGLAVGDGLDAAPVRLGELQLHARDAAGILRLAGDELLRLGREVRVIARCPGEALEVVRVGADVRGHHLGGALGRETARALAHVPARDADAIDVLADAEELAAGVHFLPARDQRPAQFVAELGIAELELKRQRLLLAGRELDVRAEDLAGRVQFRDHFRAEGERAACRAAEQLGLRAHGVAGRVVNLLHRDRCNGDGGGTEERQFDAVARDAQVGGPERVGALRAFEQLGEFVAVGVGLLLLAAGGLVNVQRGGHALLRVAGAGAHLVEAALARRIQRDGCLAAGVGEAQLKRAEAGPCIELRLVNHPRRAIRLERDRQRVQQARGHGLDPRRRQVIPRRQILSKLKHPPARRQQRDDGLLPGRPRVRIERSGLGLMVFRFEDLRFLGGP